MTHFPCSASNALVPVNSVGAANEKNVLTSSPLVSTHTTRRCCDYPSAARESYAIVLVSVTSPLSRGFPSTRVACMLPRLVISPTLGRSWQESQVTVRTSCDFD